LKYIESILITNMVKWSAARYWQGRQI